MPNYKGTRFRIQRLQWLWGPHTIICGCLEPQGYSHVSFLALWTTNPGEVIASRIITAWTVLCWYSDPSGSGPTSDGHGKELRCALARRCVEGFCILRIWETPSIKLSDDAVGASLMAHVMAPYFLIHAALGVAAYALSRGGRTSPDPPLAALALESSPNQ